MSDATENFEYQRTRLGRTRAGMVRQVLTSVFVGIPLTAGLLVAVAAYCAFEYARYTLLPKKPQREDLPASAKPLATAPSEESFTTSLSNFAAVHGVPAQVQPTEAKIATEDSLQKSI